MDLASEVSLAVLSAAFETTFTPLTPVRYEPDLREQHSEGEPGYSKL